MKPTDELIINEKLKAERDVSNETYAPIIVKTIVYSFISLICVAFVTFLVKLVW
jgi:hypothetical protein